MQLQQQQLLRAPNGSNQLNLQRSLGLVLKDATVDLQNWVAAASAAATSLRYLSIAVLLTNGSTI